jgi:protein TonB
LRDRVRERLGPRAGGFAFALAVETLLVLLLVLTLAPRVLTPPDKTVPMAVFDVNADKQQQAAERQPAPPAAAAAPRPAVQPRPQPADPDAAVQPRPTEQPQPQPTPPPFLNIPLGSMPDIGALPRGPAAPAAPRRAAGPPNLARVAGDTPRVEGRGPNGEPLYAASWYREPYDSEMRGYLSTARGPGWGMIACRTIADFRVDNCALIAEYPDGSNIGRAVLAMAWQFRVRPPRLGGVPQVGEWVRIRIDYDIKVRAE